VVILRCNRVLLVVSLLFSLAYVPLTKSEKEVTLEEIIARNAEAMGGRATIEGVKAIAVELHIVDPGFEVDGTYHAARPNRMRIDVKADGKRVFVEAFDGRRGWQWNGKGETTVDASPKATEALRRGVELPGKLYGLHELAGRGHKVEFAGREKIDGMDYYALKVTLNDGFNATFYVDPTTWLITRRRDVRPLHVDVDPTPTTIEQRSSDFRKVGGIPFAFHGEEVDLQTGKVLETTTVKEIRINPSIDESIFDKL
jgi:outer membrane lipoprotein-sorting protein